MAYTFGAGTGDDITWSSSTQAGANLSATFVYGWWYPTTLTATRGLWSFGNIIGAEIDTTTDELRLRTDNTTDGQWTTSGVDLAINNWYYLAFWFTTSNTNGATWYVWRGTHDTPPTEATVTVATARSGNFSGSATFYVGNKGTGTLAFQGDIANVGTVTSTDAGIHRWFHLTTTGSAPSAETKQLIYDEHVFAAWQDPYQYIHRIPHAFTGSTAVPASHHNTLGPGAGTPLASARWVSSTTIQPRVAPTVNGATLSTTNRGPRETNYGNELWPAFVPQLAAAL